MNAIADNAYTQTLSRLGLELLVDPPRAVLVVSAHWMTRGTFVTHMKTPRTIHDFGGFPRELFEVQYPAPGSPATADLIRTTIPNVIADESEWGLDHGTWSVLRHLVPHANIPVLQLSLSLYDSPEYHLKIGEQLKDLREKGVLILGSGNLVHNLRKIRWESDAKPYDWAVEFDRWIADRIERRDVNAIVKDALSSEAGKLSAPTPEHFLPLYYVLGASDSKDELKTEYEEMQNASISMRSFSLGRK
jgi:4,5-DOPA dioxygenase extradiol